MNKRSVYNTERSRNGFTLAEVLIVILIIAVLSGIALVFFRDVQKTARDSKRRQDLQNLQIALEAYHKKNGHYPCTTLGETGEETEWQKSTASDWLRDNKCHGPAFGQDYISDLPQDPINSGSPWFETTEGRKYSYAYWAGTTTSFDGCPGQPGQYYILVARFEKTGNKDASPEEIVNLCDGQTAVLFLIPAYDFGLNDLYIVTSQSF